MIGLVRKPGETSSLTSKNDKRPLQINTGVIGGNLILKYTIHNSKQHG